MRRAESAVGSEFEAYVAARWPGLVRSVVEQGLALSDAREVVTDALDRCRGEWRRAERHGDVEAVVEDALHRALARHRGPRDATGPERLDPGPPPTAAELERRAWQRRARANSRVVLVLVPLLALVAGATWWTTRSDSVDETLADAPLTRVENPSAAAWYDAGRLHLSDVTLQVAGLRDVTRIGDGAVYVDTSGRVVSLAANGARLVLGHQDPDEPLRASDESGWVAWIDTQQDRTVVADVVTGRRVATRSADDQRVVAVDGDTVYLRNERDRLRAWDPDTATTATLEEQPLLDVLGRKKALQRAPGEVEVVQSLFAVDFTFPGSGARLSGEGNYVATRGADGSVQLFDTRGGGPAFADQSTAGVVVAATGGERGTTTYVLDTADGRRLLQDCVSRTRTCVTAATLDPRAAVPLLAG